MNSFSEWLQLSGGVFEFLGLVTVGLGIVETRRAFTDRPSMIQKVAQAVAEFTSRLTRRKRIHSLSVEMAGEANVAGSLSLRPRYGFKGSLEERVQRIQEIAQQHADRLAELAELIESESARHRREIQSVRDSLAASEQKLQERIRKAAANGLTLETRGVALFMIGVGLSTWGGIIS